MSDNTSPPASGSIEDVLRAYVEAKNPEERRSALRVCLRRIEEDLRRNAANVHALAVATSFEVQS